MEGPFVRLSLSGDSLPFSRAAFQCSRSIRRDISMQKKQMKEMENPGIIGKNGPPAKEAD
ncbi:MAG: hypothetical protein GX776_05410 [Oxalobacter sp.]|nr:hypothetical protein [Oxalobacter sp.]